MMDDRTFGEFISLDRPSNDYGEEALVAVRTWLNRRPQCWFIPQDIKDKISKALLYHDIRATKEVVDARILNDLGKTQWGRK